MKITFGMIFMAGQTVLLILFSVFPREEELFKPNLLYLDFFKFDFYNNNVNEFVNDNFNIIFSQSFISETNNPFDLNIGFFNETEMGNLSVTLKKGKNSKQEDGIIMQTSLQCKESMSNSENLLSWLDKAHEFTSDLFKQITKGQLYESFK